MENTKLNVTISDTSDNIYLLLQTLRQVVNDLVVEYKAQTDIDIKSYIEKKSKVMNNLLDSISNSYWNK